MRVCPIRIGPLSNWSRIRVGRRVEAGGRRREEATSIHWRFNEKQQRNCSAQRAEFPYSVLALAVKPACRSLRSMLNSGCNLFAVVYPTSSWDRSNPRDTPRTSVSLSLHPLAWPTSRGESARSLEHYALSSSVSRSLSLSLRLSMCVESSRSLFSLSFSLELMDKPFLSLSLSLPPPPPPPHPANCQVANPNFVIEL